MNAKYRNQITHAYDGEKFVLKNVITVPDQALSVRDILDRYVRGRDVETFAGVYTDSDLVPDNWERMDQIERTEYVRSMKEDLVQKMKRATSRPTKASDEEVLTPSPSRVEPAE